MLKLIKFLSPYKGRVTAMLILLFLQVLGTLYIPTLTADIVNNGIVAGDLDHIWKTGGFMLAAAVLIPQFLWRKPICLLPSFPGWAGTSATHCLKNLRRSPSTNSISLAPRP